MASLWRRNSKIRLLALCAAAAVLAGCAQTGPMNSGHQPQYAGTAPDVARLLHYCDRMAAQGNLDLALGMCARAHEKDQTNPLPLVKLAGVLTGLGRHEDALRSYRVLLAVDPLHVEGRYRLARSLIDLGRFQEAREELERALQVAPDDVRLYNALAVMTDKAGRHEEAQALYRSGLAYDPGNLSLRSNLGLSLVLGGQHAEGLALLSEIAAHPAAGPVTRANLALAQSHLERSRRLSEDTALVAPRTPVERRPIPTPLRSGAVSAPASLEPEPGLMATPLVMPGRGTASIALDSDALPEPQAGALRLLPPEQEAEDERDRVAEGGTAIETWLSGVFSNLFD